ncbi:TIGR03620 family F420-dependent LLM class oxidoreductase [Streptomyces sp. NBC_01476]|uniref:TIGR03620 family F420-dependent LLM class oxidoreductase n=1 Tax=Streptomyces sp. NBC_01476 TaxID=2903881 RepID=UPI002E3742D6|nr:TIGR03620 family F420-dependent LLM class oxidoreductase [Streptomyces sp. NBC_01476]
MGTTTVIDAARRALGPVGVTLPVSFTTALSIDAQRKAVDRLERAGYRAVWTNEVIGGKDALVQLAVLLAATDRMVFGTGVANIWARQPPTMHGAAAVLAQAYPGRFVLGMGVGYPQQAASVGLEFGTPLATLRAYLNRMAAPTQPPAPDVPYPRIIAANGPKMLALAGEIADGALPAVQPPEFTVRARRTLGPDKLLVIGLSVVPDDDRDRARAVARQRMAEALDRPSYAAALAQLGYSEREITEVGDRLVDAVIAHGDPAAIADRVREHLAAGADHVTLLPQIGTAFSVGVDQLEWLAPALTSIDRR